MSGKNEKLITPRILILSVLTVGSVMALVAVKVSWHANFLDHSARRVAVAENMLSGSTLAVECEKEAYKQGVGSKYIKPFCQCLGIKARWGFIISNAYRSGEMYIDPSIFSRAVDYCARDLAPRVTPPTGQ